MGVGGGGSGGARAAVRSCGGRWDRGAYLVISHGHNGRNDERLITELRDEDHGKGLPERGDEARVLGLGLDRGLRGIGRLAFLYIWTTRGSRYEVYYIEENDEEHQHALEDALSAFRKLDGLVGVSSTSANPTEAEVYK